MEKLVIFDFDGVIVDSFDVWYKINAYAFRRALDKNLTRNQYRDCYMNELNNGLKALASGKKAYQKLKNFKNAHREEFFLKYYSKVKLFPFIKSLIYKLKELNVKLVIVTSSTNPAGVMNLLKKFKLDKNFTVALSSEGESKIAYLKRIMTTFNSKPKDIFFITDTYNDVKWGNKVGIKTIGVLWGFHSKQILIKAKPDFIVKDYKDIIRIIKK